MLAAHVALTCSNTDCFRWTSRVQCSRISTTHAQPCVKLGSILGFGLQEVMGLFLNSHGVKVTALIIIMTSGGVHMSWFESYRIGILACPVLSRSTMRAWCYCYDGDAFQCCDGAYNHYMAGCLSHQPIVPMFMTAFHGDVMDQEEPPFLKGNDNGMSLAEKLMHCTTPSNASNHASQD